MKLTRSGRSVNRPSKYVESPGEELEKQQTTVGEKQLTAVKQVEVTNQLLVGKQLVGNEQLVGIKRLVMKEVDRKTVKRKEAKRKDAFERKEGEIHKDYFLGSRDLDKNIIGCDDIFLYSTKHIDEISGDEKAGKCGSSSFMSAEHHVEEGNKDRKQSRGLRTGLPESEEAEGMSFMSLADTMEQDLGEDTREESCKMDEESGEGDDSHSLILRGEEEELEEHSMEDQNLMIQENQRLTLEEQLALIHHHRHPSSPTPSSTSSAVAPAADITTNIISSHPSHQSQAMLDNRIPGCVVDEEDYEEDYEEGDVNEVLSGHHVISIEEDGQITIENISGTEDVSPADSLTDRVSTLFPPWYQRLSTLLQGFLTTGWMVDLLLVCDDGKTVPAHQLILGHASPLLARIMAETRLGNQDETLSVSLPGTSFRTLAAFVSALYSGILPAEPQLCSGIQTLAASLGMPGFTQVSKESSPALRLIRGTRNKKLIVLPSLVKQEKAPEFVGLTGKRATNKCDPELEGVTSLVAQQGVEVQSSVKREKSVLTSSSTVRLRSDVVISHDPDSEAVVSDGRRPDGDNSSGLEAHQVKFSNHQVQLVQTDSGEILFVTCDNSVLDPPPGQQVSGDLLEEKSGERFQSGVEKLKQIKMEQIKEQQNKVCPACNKAALTHRYRCNPGDQRFVYKCCKPECETTHLIKTARSFNQHMATHNSQLAVKYEPADRVCPLCFKSRIEHKNRNLSDEEKGNHRGNLYKCCHCSASKLSAKKFFIHIENHVSKKHVCQLCSKGYSYKHLLDEHIWKEHGEGQNIRYPCSWEGCDYSAKYKQTLHTHVTEHHHGIKRKQRQEDSGKRISCPSCGKVLKTWYYHQFHKKTCTTGNIIYQCDICLKEGFINSVTLQNHVRVKHSGERPYACQYCPAKYATAMSLAGHRARKHGMNSRGEAVPKKIFPCAQCGRVLTSRIKLKSHVEVVHLGKRNYSCGYCEKKFTSKSNLQIHEGSQHTGVLPYKCSFCDKTFARKSQLSQHCEQVHPGHAGQFYVVEDVGSVQVGDVIIPVDSVEEGRPVEISVPMMESIHV